MKKLQKYFGIEEGELFGLILGPFLMGVITVVSVTVMFDIITTVLIKFTLFEVIVWIMIGFGVFVGGFIALWIIGLIAALIVNFILGLGGK